VERAFRGLVFFSKHEAHEVLLAHESIRALQLFGHLREDAVDRLPRERVSLLLGELVLGDEEVVVLVQLPKPALEHVKVLLGEQLAHVVDVVLLVHLHEDVLEVAFLHVLQGEAAAVVQVLCPEDTDDHRVGLALLELGSALQEEQPWVDAQQVLQNGLQVSCPDSQPVSTDCLKEVALGTVIRQVLFIV